MSIRSDLQVSFKINGKIHNIEFSHDEVVLYNNLIDNDEFTLKYLNILISSEEILLDEELNEIYRLDSNGNLEHKIFPVKHTNEVEYKDKWYGPETSFLLEQYEMYIKEVGQSKLYRNKKCMWEQIAADINRVFKMEKTSVQVENRFKTLRRRKIGELRYRRTDKEEDSNLRDKLRVLSLERPPKRKYRQFYSISNSPPSKKYRSLQETSSDSEEDSDEEIMLAKKVILSKLHIAAAQGRHEETLSLLRKKEALEEKIHKLELQRIEENFQKRLRNETESLFSEV